MSTSSAPESELVTKSRPSEPFLSPPPLSSSESGDRGRAAASVGGGTRGGRRGHTEGGMEGRGKRDRGVLVCSPHVQASVRG